MYLLISTAGKGKIHGGDRFQGARRAASNRENSLHTPLSKQGGIGYKKNEYFFCDTRAGLILFASNRRVIIGIDNGPERW
jgi:hypothetical protein